jgi:hypothetical protein
MSRIATVALVLALMAGPVLAAGSTANLPEPDPTAANLTPDGIRQRAQDACIALQAEKMAVPQETVRGACACYARRTVAKMDKDEIAAFRKTGYFNDSAREKALESLDACKLKRPA